MLLFSLATDCLFSVSEEYHQKSHDFNYTGKHTYIYIHMQRLQTSCGRVQYVYMRMYVYACRYVLQGFDTEEGGSPGISPPPPHPTHSLNPFNSCNKRGVFSPVLDFFLLLSNSHACFPPKRKFCINQVTSCLNPKKIFIQRRFVDL